MARPAPAASSCGPALQEGNEIVEMVDDGVGRQILDRAVEETEADRDAGDARIARARYVVDRVSDEDCPATARALDPGADGGGIGLGDAHRVAAHDAGETRRQA